MRVLFPAAGLGDPRAAEGSSRGAAAHMHWILGRAGSGMDLKGGGRTGPAGTRVTVRAAGCDALRMNWVGLRGSGFERDGSEWIKGIAFWMKYPIIRSINLSFRSEAMPGVTAVGDAAGGRGAFEGRQA